MPSPSVDTVQLAQPSRSVRARLLARVFAAATLMSVFLWPGVSAQAHSLAPCLLIVHELSNNRAEISWKTPVLRLTGADPQPVLPSDCEPEGAPKLTDDEESETKTWTVRCAAPSFVGRRIDIDGLAIAKTDALLRVELADGRAIDTVLRSSDSSFVVPARENRSDLVGRYVRLGFDYVLSGYEDVLFIFALLLLVSNTRALIATLLAFTLGHSITLTLAVLEVARVPAAPIEALLALGIFGLAVELARPAAARTRMRERPWVMAALFGLLQGLGFAGALRRAGLPEDGIPLALLCFNVGIELGQLAFVLTILAMRQAVGSLALTPPAWARTAVIYAIGSVAALWLIQRSLPLLAVPALASTFGHG